MDETPKTPPLHNVEFPRETIYVEYSEWETEFFAELEPPSEIGFDYYPSYSADYYVIEELIDNKNLIMALDKIKDTPELSSDERQMLFGTIFVSQEFWNKDESMKQYLLYIVNQVAENDENWTIGYVTRENKHFNEKYIQFFKSNDELKWKFL